MRWMKWIGLLSVLLLLISCFTPWVLIASKQMVISGVDATGTNFGKPGYFHFFLSFFYVLFTFIQRVWAKRFNLLVSGLNIAWAIRNYIIISACQMGECPEKQSGIYLIVLASALMLLAAVFPDVKLKEEIK
ncbi:MAG TPA: hypothetical protein VFS36_14045 [Chitinophagaceae bacterium]|jgi:hypothetical protein|nr:hypothetical protein [Chitinophagaceae bacterium]